MSVIVSIALATICFSYQGQEECHPVLLGKNIPTPTGEFNMRKRITKDPGYGGDVLQFHEIKDMVFAIHRVWLLKPEQRRIDRLKSNNIQDRYISSGCINVMPEVYDRLMDCCSDQKLVVR
jgi:hypothetical protein